MDAFRRMESTAGSSRRAVLAAALAGAALPAAAAPAGMRGKGTKRPLALALATVRRHEPAFGAGPQRPSFLAVLEITAYDLRPSEPVPVQIDARGAVVEAVSAAAPRAGIAAKVREAVVEAFGPGLPPSRIDVLLA